MASPQVENGYTKIASELLDAIMRYKCGGIQKDIIMCVIRYTYGYQRKEHFLGTGFIANAIGRNSRRVAQEIEKLIERNVLIEVRSYTENSPRILKLNKNYDNWVCAGPLTVSETAHQDINNHKINITSHRQKKKETVKSNREKEAETVYEYYAANICAGARADAIKSIKKLLEDGESETALIGYIDNYRINGMPKDKQYRIQANNFFGRAVRYQDYMEAENRNGIPRAVQELPDLT